MILSKRRRVRKAFAKRRIFGDYKPMAQLHEIKQLTTSIERHIAGIERRLVTDA
jgi:hypothetical protein